MLTLILDSFDSVLVHARRILELNEFGQQKVQATREELEMEREAVSDIMG